MFRTAEGTKKDKDIIKGGKKQQETAGKLFSIFHFKVEKLHCVALMWSQTHKQLQNLHLRFNNNDNNEEEEEMTT